LRGPSLEIALPLSAGPKLVFRLVEGLMTPAMWPEPAMTYSAIFNFIRRGLRRTASAHVHDGAFGRVTGTPHWSTPPEQALPKGWRDKSVITKILL
jgi:hypothetical protein